MLADHLQDVRVEWLWRGGAGVSFAEKYGTRYRARGHRIFILMVGGNNIDNGMSPFQLADRMGRLAYDYAHLQGGPDHLYGQDKMAITTDKLRCMLTSWRQDGLGTPK